MEASGRPPRPQAHLLLGYGGESLGRGFGELTGRERQQKGGGRGKGEPLTPATGRRLLLWGVAVKAEVPPL